MNYYVKVKNFGLFCDYLMADTKMEAKKGKEWIPVPVEIDNALMHLFSYFKENEIRRLKETE